MWSFFSRDFSKDFPYEIGELVPGLENKSVWQLHKAKKKGSSEEVSVFVFEVKNGSEIQFEIAKASIKRLKTLRHPSILTFLDSYESDKFLYLATEYVEPLENHITHLSKENQQKDLYLAWESFKSLYRALSFLNNDGNLRHNNVCLSSVFVNAAGEWFLGGVEYVSGQNDALPIKILPELEKYEPPEKTDPNKQNHMTKCSTDMWGLGCLIWEAFNGPLPRQSALKQIENIPKQLSSLYCELVGANPTSRPNPADVITRCRRQGGYFKNDLVDALLFLEEIQIKDRAEKSRFFGALTSQLDQFPPHVCRLKILPQLVTAFEYGDAGAAVLAPMFKLGRLLEENEYQKTIVPCVVRLFASTDRATRIRLLQQLEQFIGHLQSATVNDAIFPQIALGFTDTNATIREQTVKSVIHLAPKLNYNNLNVEVLRHFARLQAKDEQGGIRTNTTVCLGKIAQHLHPQIRQKVLISAFIRAMRDPFPLLEVLVGILALAATQQYFLLSEVASRILPALCQLTIDPEKQVRENAFRAIKGFLGKLEKVSEDPSLRESMEADVHTATPSLSNAAATWAGWAVSAVTAKFYRSQSDTVRSSSGGNFSSTHGKSLSKTSASLEQPSSSSLSTTTSSVTSMTSLEQEEGSKGQESVSDYDEHWEENDAWGEMESSRPSASLGRMTTATTATSSANAQSLSAPGLSMSASMTAAAMPSDGWDTEEWGSLDEAPELESPGEDAWSATATDFNKEKIDETPKDIKEEESEWKDNEWEPLEEPSSSSKLEEARRKREERKLHRQRELEAKRANRTSSGGPMKLAAKKFNLLPSNIFPFSQLSYNFFYY